jgi:hypothetical protein
MDVKFKLENGTRSKRNPAKPNLPAVNRTWKKVSYYKD